MERVDFVMFVYQRIFLEETEKEKKIENLA